MTVQNNRPNGILIVPNSVAKFGYFRLTSAICGQMWLFSVVFTLHPPTTGGLLENRVVVYFEVSNWSNFSVHAMTRELANFGRQNFLKFLVSQRSVFSAILIVLGEIFINNGMVLIPSPRYEPLRQSGTKYK